MMPCLSSRPLPNCLVGSSGTSFPRTTSAPIGTMANAAAGQKIARTERSTAATLWRTAIAVACGSIQPRCRGSGSPKTMQGKGQGQGRAWARARQSVGKTRATRQAEQGQGQEQGQHRQAAAPDGAPLEPPSAHAASATIPWLGLAFACSCLSTSEDKGNVKANLAASASCQVVSTWLTRCKRGQLV